MNVVPADDFDPDRPVIEAVRRGDRHAFEELWRRNAGWVRGVVFGILGDRHRVEDVSQQVWTTAWECLGELRDTNRWRPWLYRLARNAAIDAGRDITRRKQRGNEWQRSAPRDTSSTTVDHGVADSEQHETVLSAIQGLPAIYREPFVLRHLNDWSYAQISEVMGLSVDTVETRLVRARRLLRECLKEQVGKET